MTTTSRSMELISKEEAGKDIKFKHYDGRANVIRKGLKDALATTDQEGAFKKMRDHGFEIQFEKGEMCNFPITLVIFRGEIPAVGKGAAHKVPEATYMFFDFSARQLPNNRLLLPNSNKGYGMQHIQGHVHAKIQTFTPRNQCKLCTRGVPRIQM